MRPAGASRARAALAWAALATAIAVPVLAAATSPLLAWRAPVYIAGGFAGVVAMALLLVQPLLAGGYLPGLDALRGRRLHRAVGAALVTAVILHVAALWITSPPDVIDALTLASPAPFAPWGVIAMWAVFAAALVAAFRRRLRPQVWRPLHRALASVIVAGSVVHALLIVGTMEPVSKAALGVLIVAATLMVIAGPRARPVRPRRGP